MLFHLAGISAIISNKSSISYTNSHFQPVDSNLTRTAALIQRLIDGKGLTIRAIARISGISHTHIGDMASGASSPMLDKLEKLAPVLGVTARELKPEHIDLEKCVLTVPPTKRTPPYRIPLIDPLRPVLAEWLASGGKWRHDRSFYVHESRKRVDALGILVRQPLHGLRHGFASSAVSAGIPMPWLSKYMGHTTQAVTAKYYDHSGLVDDDPEPEFLALLDWINGRGRGTVEL